MGFFAFCCPSSTLVTGAGRLFSKLLMCMNFSASSNISTFSKGPNFSLFFYKNPFLSLGYTNKWALLTTLLLVSRPYKLQLLWCIVRNGNQLLPGSREINLKYMLCLALMLLAFNLHMSGYLQIPFQLF